MSHRHLNKVMYAESNITNTQLKIITYCNYVTYYLMCMSLTQLPIVIMSHTMTCTQH